MSKHSLRVRLLCVAIASALSLPVVAQDAADKPATLDTISVVGSRASNRSATETVAPVDIITREMIEGTGAAEVGRLLQKIAPSFNFPQSFVSDGTDLIWPASLRGMGPDQVLVLVNGKRRHQQGLVNVQQSIGRGSAGTDINTIPISAIERIEILRDGASAQYGSDAIAGVINIILKSADHGGSVNAEVGQTYEGDGDTTRIGANAGFKLGDSGFLNLTAEYLDRGETNRAGPDRLRVNPPRVTQRIGDADTESKLLWLNAEVPLGEATLYAFGGASERDANSSGFFRTAGDGRTVPALYPNGFLPTLLTTTKDWSFAVGLRGAFNDNWDYDFSVNHGDNSFNFAGANTVNVSWFYEPRAGGIYGESPTSSDSSGRLGMDQTTVNFDTRGTVDWGVGYEPLSLAAGVEWRQDGYSIEAGDPVSWSYGRTNNPAIVIRNQAGGIAAAGLQGFPGFQPSTEVDKDRRSVGVYLEGESYLTEQFLLNAAVRYEDYSDAGQNSTGKLAMRYNFTEAFSLRGAISTGFRAPGIQQQYFSQVSTTLSGGTLIDSITARQGSAVAAGLGFKPLQEETSTNYTIGFAYRPDNGFSLTVDAYRIDIDDRIVLSGDISASYSAAVGAILNPLRVGLANLFTNAIDTQTTGIDIVGQYTMKLADDAELTLDASFSHNRTSVERINSQSSLLPASVIFPEAQVTLVEEALPRNRAGIGATYKTGAWTVSVNNSYYGKVRGVGFGPEYRGAGKWLTDLAVNYQITDNLDLTVGGNNVFDTYPSKWAGGENPDNNPFPGLGFNYGWETLPFGLNGGYYYGRINWTF
ncbi:MAG: TonB-dependent receptor [Lysobacterales bacterium]